MVAYPSITTPYTVSGTITTNGDIGTALPASDITAWDIIVSQGTTTIFMMTGTNSQVGGAFDADTQSITVNPNAELSFINSTDFIQWFGHPPGPPFYAAEISGSELWEATLPAVDSPVATASTVPEPSSAVLAGICAGLVIACGLVRKRCEHRRQAVA
jgi:hypothetical protein